MKYLFLGDPHVQKSNLEESARLMKWVISNLIDGQTQLIILGDLYHDFGTVRVEVLSFWDYWLREAAKIAKVFVITGNHDMNSECTHTALTAHASIPEVKIVGPNEYLEIAGYKEKIFLLPFHRHNENFTAAVKSVAAFGATTVICHQEFDGAKYETGMYAPHGAKLEELPSSVNFISGHIHTAQLITDPATGVGRVLYLGTPRQLTRADIGTTKVITLWDEYAGIFKSIPTPREVSEPFEYIVIDENNPDPVVPSSPRVYVDVKGSAEFIKKVIRKMPEGVKLRAFPETEHNSATVKESSGIPVAFHGWWSNFECTNSAAKDSALKIIYEKCPILKGGIK